jgi:hypothetical protein
VAVRDFTVRCQEGARHRGAGPKIRSLTRAARDLGSGQGEPPDHSVIAGGRASQEYYRRKDWHSPASRALLCASWRGCCPCLGSCPAGDVAIAGLRR